MNARLWHRLRAATFALGVALAGSLAHAGLGLMQLPGLAGDGPVTVFYPTAAPDQTLADLAPPDSAPPDLAPPDQSPPSS